MRIRHMVVICALAFISMALLSFQISDNNNYNEMWKKVKESLSKDLPETAEKQLDDIEKVALSKRNQPQLLKSILYRKQIFALKEEDSPEKAYLDYAATKFDVLDEVASALLHIDVAKTYADYLEMNEWSIRNNLPIAGDKSSVEMKYWDKQTFRKLIDQHFDKALQNRDVLKKTETKDWLLLYDEKDIDEYIEYEMSMFEFVFHVTANYYKNISSANDVDGSWNTQLWWLDDIDFVNANLGESDSPLIRCLKIFQDLISYSMEKGKENVLVFHDVRRYLFVNDILDKEDLFYEKLETLMHRYGGNHLSAEIASVYAKNLVDNYSDTDSTTYDNYAKALKLAKTYISRFPKSEGAKQCQSVVDFIVDDDVSVEMQNTQLPNQPIAAILSYRNTQHPYYKIVRVNEAELQEYKNLYGDKLVDKLLKQKAVVEKELNIPEENDYRRHSSLIDLPKLSVGQYYLLVKTSKNASDKKTKMAAIGFQVSNLSYAYVEEEKAITLYVMNRKTGAPMANVDVELYTNTYDYQLRKRISTKIATYKSNGSGKVAMGQLKQRESFFVNLRYGNDVLLSDRYMNVPEPYYGQNVSYRTTLFTDRAIYRPGQTVYFKGVVIQQSNEDKQLAEGIKDKVVFRDDNWQEIGSLEFETDEYGSYSGSFIIPTDLLNGQFHLLSDYGGTSIRVEEYKRPTFEITFEKPKEQYKLNQDVTVHGSVDAYAGFVLDDVKYSYRVIRKTNFPWRLWWWSYPSVEDEQIDFGEARTDANGKFSISFNLKPSLDVKPEQQPLFVYEIEVTATSAQGETHSETYSIRAGYNEICISTNMSQMVEMDDMPKCVLEVMNMSGEPAKSKVSRKIYLYADNGRIDFFDSNGSTCRMSRIMLDRQLLTDEELANKFQTFDFYKENNRQQNRILVYEDVVDVTEKANLFPANVVLQPGAYYVELKSIDDPLAISGTEFKLFDDESAQMPYTSMMWSNVDKKTAHPGETITFSLGSSAKNVKMWVRLMSEKNIRIEKWIDVDDGIVKLPYVVKEEDRGELGLNVVFVKDGIVKRNNINVSVPYDNLKLNVELATVRDVLTPGAEERWEVTVRDNEKIPVASALMAGMYDASLDIFASNSWHFDMSPWQYGHNSFISDEGFGMNMSSTQLSYIDYFVLFNYRLPSDAPFSYALGYGGMYRKSFAVASSKSVMYAATDEVAVAEEAIDEIMMVQSANGAYMMDEAEMPMAPEPNEMKTESASNAEESSPSIRENFNETAFFFPDLRTNNDGSATFSFVMPDALTRWKLMMLAYTKDNKSGYNTYNFKSSKPVMIMADMPRYMYDNDTLWFVANVINTGDEPVTPKAKLEIFDAATMQPADIIVSDPVVPMQELVPGRSKEVRWQVVAKHDLGLVAFRFTAYAGEFSDAEQHLLPVLSSEVFMTQTIPITVQAESKKKIDVRKAANTGSHERDYGLTLNFSTNPTWYAVQSLPYLADVNDKRAESAFYVLYANTLSAYVANKIPNLMNYIKKWQIETPDALMSQLEKDQDLKAIMLQETPWVVEAKNETEQRRRISNLFDINTMRNQQDKAMTLISNKQTYNGGWSWWDGMPESPSITSYILSGFGKLQSLGAIDALSQANQRSVQNICQKAVKCLEYEVANEYRRMKKAGKEWTIGSLTLDELYALSFFKEQNSDKDFAAAKKYYLASLDKNWTNFNFYMRSKAALVLYRNGNEKTARLILQSFRECAQKDENIGVYWPKKYFSFESHIATHANIMSAFAEIENDREMIDQLRIWLLTQKQTNMWENSSSTAEAIYALLMRGSDWLTDDKEVTLSFGNKQITQEGAVAGTGFIQRRWNAGEMADDMKTLTVDNPTKHLVWGGLFRQYFVPIDEVKQDEAAFKIKRELFVERVTNTGRELVPISKQTLQVGDKITVKITFESSQDMEYVFVKDLRAAGFEPIDQVSRYEYNDDMSYYQTNTDTDMEFFIEFLPKGVHQVEYSMYVTKEGNLTNGYALIQSLYAPEFSAYSDGIRVKVGE